MTARRITVAASEADDARTLTFDYDFGDNLKEAVSKFGEEIVFDHFVDNCVIAVQGMVRTRLKKTDDKFQQDKTILDAVAAWRPGQRKQVDPAKRKERIVSDVGKLDAADRAALLKQLQASIEAENKAKVKPGLMKKGKAA